MVCSWCALLLVLFALPAYSLDELPPGAHCIGMTTGEPEEPLYASWQYELPPPEVRRHPQFPGCTWGAVYFRGQPVRGAEVTLRFGGQTAKTGAYHYFEQEGPFYSISAADLGAKRGDMLTLIVEFAGQRFERTFRAQPNAEGEQEVAVALEEVGVWSTWFRGPYTSTLAVAGDTLWAGGTGGLVAVAPQGAPQERTPAWPDKTVSALAVGLNGDIWAAGPAGVAQWNGSAWQQHTLPIAGSPFALEVDPAGGAVWVATDRNLGAWGPTALAVYDGAWREVRNNLLIRGLAVDAGGDVWAATWGAALYRRSGEQWMLADGSDAIPQYLHVVRIQEHPRRSAWVGASSLDIALDRACGVAQLDTSTGQWRCMTPAHGLPSLENLKERPADVYAIEFDVDGTAYAGTARGVYVRAAESRWANIRPGSHEPAGALAFVGEDLAMAGPSGIERLDLGAVPGVLPQAAINAPVQVSPADDLVLTGAAVDRDEQGGAVVAWDWRSDLDGSLCTTAERCTIPAAQLRQGVHHLSLRVQDDEGMWSTASTAETEVLANAPLFLPAVLAER